MKQQFKYRRLRGAKSIKRQAEAKMRAPINQYRKVYLRGTPGVALRNFRAKKKKTQLIRLQASGGEVTQSSWMLENPPRASRAAIIRAISLVGQSNIYMRQKPLILNAAAGFQNFKSVSHQSISDLLYIRSLISGTINQPMRYVLQDYTSELAFTNTTNSSLEIELFDIILRRDLQSQTTYVPPSGGPFILNGDPETYWDVGVKVMSGQSPTTTPSNSLTVGALPFDSQLFRDFFKVVRRTKVMMSQGASHRHFIHLKANHIVLDSEVNLYGNQTGRAGLTCYTLFVLKGLPQSVGVSNPGTATTSPGQLAIVQQTRYKYTFSQDIQQNGTYDDNLTTPATTAVLNVGSGLVDVYATTA